MNSILTRRFEMFMRVRAYGAERAASFPPNSLGGEQFAAVTEVVEALTRDAAMQSSGVSSVQQASSSRAGAREALRESLQALTRTARAMALDRPGLENKFRLPRSGSDQALLNTARAFMADAAPLKLDFIKHELPPSFLEELEMDISNLEAAIGSQNTGRHTHVAATASIDSAVERGMIAVRRLDAIVRNKFRDNAAALAAWESARHVERSARVPKKGNAEQTAQAS